MRCDAALMQELPVLSERMNRWMGRMGRVGGKEEDDGRDGRDCREVNGNGVLRDRVGSRGWRIGAEMGVWRFVVLPTSYSSCRPRPTWDCAAAVSLVSLCLASLRRAHRAALGSLGGGETSRAKH